VGAGDLASPAPPSASELERFRVAGGHLARRGLVQGTEGNLSTFDGARLLITRTGSDLADLGARDVLAGTPEDPPEGSSSDLDVHLDTYRDNHRLNGVRAIVHAHPPGSMTEPGAESPSHGRHGVCGTGRTLEHALAMVEMVLHTRSGPRSPPLAGMIAGPFSAVWLSLGSGGRWDGEKLVPEKGPILEGFDQARSPFSVDEGFSCRTVEEVADAVRRMAVRGAPVLGITAALGVALAAFRALELGEPAREAAEKASALLVSARPTAVNMRWAVERVLRVTERSGADDDRRYAEALLAEARRIEQEDADACSAMGWFGAELVPPGARILTHCNTGMLCTAGIGTAFGVIWCAHLAGKDVRVWVDETRPLLQGARLTAWELQRLGVPQTLVPDSAGASLMASGEVDLVVTGADRVAANGDVANKIGTYGLAVLARHHGLPFYVVAPTSTVDPDTATGARIRIEERDPDEVAAPLGMRIVPEGVPAANPAFDVTPAELVTALVTERGVIRRPTHPAIAALLAGARSS
jgi:methylthioribose-1-phosphate isomerase